MRGGFHGLQIKAAVWLAVTFLVGLAIRGYQAQKPLPEVDPALARRFQAIADSLNRLSAKPARLAMDYESKGAESKGWRVNINQADLEQLMRLPGIGETLAKRILADRKENGPFTRAEDLMRVSGIGEKKLSRMRPYIRLKE